MTEAGRKRASAWKIAGVVVGAFALLAIAAAIWMKMAVDRGLAKRDHELKAEIADEGARGGARPVLWGEVRPGNAWDEYDQALAEALKISGRTGLGGILDPKHDDQPDGPLAKLPLYASPLAHLLRISLAIARCPSAHGKPPESLQSLLPAYLPPVPLCPLTGLPLRCREGRIWSVGQNRVDDGAVEDASGRG